MLHQIIYRVNYGVDLFIILVLDLDSYRFGQSAGSSLSSYKFELSSIDLAISPLSVMSKG